MELYVVSETKDGPIKIGRSQNCGSRVCALQTGNPRLLLVAMAWKMEPDEAIEAEKILHDELKQFKLMGEWFDLPEDFMVDYMPDFFKANGYEATVII